jgi:hypothetical protein
MQHELHVDSQPVLMYNSGMAGYGHGPCGGNGYDIEEEIAHETRFRGEDVRLEENAAKMLKRAEEDVCMSSDAGDIAMSTQVAISVEDVETFLGVSAELLDAKECGFGSPAAGYGRSASGGGGVPAINTYEYKLGLLQDNDVKFFRECA